VNQSDFVHGAKDHPAWLTGTNAPVLQSSSNGQQRHMGLKEWLPGQRALGFFASEELPGS
jgi:hypothetical protein